MIRKKNLIKNIRIERVCLFPLEILEINSLSSNEDEGTLSWIYLVEGNLSIESSVDSNIIVDITNKLCDVRTLSEEFIKLSAGNVGCALLLIFGTDIDCLIHNLKHNSTIVALNHFYILPLVNNLEFLNSDKEIKIQNIISLSKDKFIQFKKINNDLDHIMIIDVKK